jgi:hypothetical protein
MRQWTLLPLDPTDTPACWTCAERSGNRSSRPSRGTTTPRRDRLHRSAEERRRPRSTAFGLPPRSPAGPPEAACRQGEEGIEAPAAPPRASHWGTASGCSGCPSPGSVCGAACLWAGCSIRCTVGVGSAAPGAVAGEHRSVAGWSARRGGRARPGSRLGAARCTDRAGSASRPGRGRSSRGERGYPASVSGQRGPEEIPAACFSAAGRGHAGRGHRVPWFIGPVPVGLTTLVDPR